MTDTEIPPDKLDIMKKMEGEGKPVPPDIITVRDIMRFKNCGERHARAHGDKWVREGRAELVKLMVGGAWRNGYRLKVEGQ